MIEFQEGYHTYYIYILTNKAKTVLYTGVTNNLKLRLSQHQEALDSNSFSSKAARVSLPAAGNYCDRSAGLWRNHLYRWRNITANFFKYGWSEPIPGQTIWSQSIGQQSVWPVIFFSYLLLHPSRHLGWGAWDKLQVTAQCCGIIYNIRNERYLPVPRPSELQLPASSILVKVARGTGLLKKNPW